MSSQHSTLLKLQNKEPVCIVGNLNIDLIIRNVPHLPNWGQEVLGSDHIMVSSGQGGYLAFALSRLGVPVEIIGNVGDDLYGDQILADLRHFGVDVSAVEITPNLPTGITVAIVRPDGERAFVTNLSSLTMFNTNFIERHRDAIDRSGLVALAGLFMLSGLGIEGATDFLGGARENGKITMLDTGWDPSDWPVDTISGIRRLLQEVHVFLPNMDEATAITGEKDVERALDHLQVLGPHLTVIKCGSQGSFARIDNKTIHVPARNVSVFDAVGAGDVFNASLISALRWGWPVEACMGLGNTAASIYISHRTDRFPKLKDVLSTARSAYSFIPDTP